MKLRINIVIIVCLLSAADAFRWPWKSTSTSLQSALPTSSSMPANGSFVSVASNLTVPSSYYASGQAYAPKSTNCPSEPIMREASNISSREKDYIDKRLVKTSKKLITFLDKVANLSDFDAEKFISGVSKNISIGLAFSGGGYRAMLSGAGSLLALDDRFENSTKNALGGLLQSSSYISGLSGGAWLVGSLAVNNWISVADILKENSGIWDLSDSIFNPNGIRLISTISYYNQLRLAVRAKRLAGFETSVTDVWGRALSFQFFNDSFYNGDENFTWTGITHLASFQNHDLPFPILISNGRNPGSTIVNLNSTVFEMTPYELGSWDASLNSFVDNRFLGTSLNDGMPNETYCVTNYDNAGFFMGTSSSIFNQLLVTMETSTNLSWVLRRILSSIFSGVRRADNDIATYSPNPFYNSSHADSETITRSDSLNLVDGGEDDQNVPYYPLIQNSRDVDVIFSFDNSADTPANWPNGSAIEFTYKRQFTPQGYGTPFPYVPSFRTFLEKGLNERPVFFGCDASALEPLMTFHRSKKKSTDVPLVVYIPASQYSYEANTSTYKMSYDNDEKFSMIANGYEVMSMNNRTGDENWNKCVGCAIIRREQERSGEEQSDECKKCFAKYCWVGGLEDSAEPRASIILDLMTSSASQTSSFSQSVTESTSQTLSLSQTTKSGGPEGSASSVLSSMGSMLSA